MPDLASLVCDDVLRWAETYTGPPFHAMLCDPPYELHFMSREWDRTGIAFRSATWQALAQHLLPGAFLMVFASARGWHRLACALEDAGLIIHPSIFGWGFGSGFPKATRIEDKLFTGYRYGLQSLKPAIEPIIVAQVPYRGRPFDSIAQTGAGALNIEGGRVGDVTDSRRAKGQDSGAFPHSDDAWIPHMAETGHVGKRWPPNFALVHLPACVPSGTREVSVSVGIGIRDNRGTPHDWMQPRQSSRNDTHPGYVSPEGTEVVSAYVCAEGCPVAALDAQAGERKAGGAKDCREQAHGFMSPRTSTRQQTYDSYGDDGACSRFFFTADWSLDVAEQLAQAAPVMYQAKASRTERDDGVSGRNVHPTVKPLALLKWLATLLLPPAAYAPRRLLVPFAGSGSECIGGVLAGWEHVLGIEQDAAYVAMARQRIAWWTGFTPPQTTSPSPPVSQASGPATQLPLF